MKFLISLFWLIIFTKKLFFWVWLWQLKEYHFGRFGDHFRTEKGKRLFLNRLVIIKLLTLVGLILFSPFFSFLLFLIFLLEVLYLFWHLFQKTLKIPVLTKKTFVILTTGIFGELFLLFYLYQLPHSWAYVSFLSLDLISPLIFSFLVLSFQPLTIFFRNRIIEKAKRKRVSFSNLLVIGITGSYGKTSTKEFLATILAEKFKVLKTKEHQNSEMGISQCILNDLKKDHQIFVVEMAAYNRGGIKLLSDIAKPKIGIITGINEQHLATFGSRENIIKTKFELIQSLPEDGLAVLNDSDPRIKNEKLKIKNYNPKLKNIKIYSLDEKNDIWAKDIKVEKKEVTFKIFSREGDSANFRVNVLGAYNILNLLGATIVAKTLGMNLGEISKACEKIEPWQAGIQVKEGINGLNIIDSTYSANPDGVISHLDYLKIWPEKKVIIIPCLIELGSAATEVHQRIGEKIGQVCDLAIITAKERFKEIKEKAIEKGMRKENILCLENPREIFEKIKIFCQKGDVILLEGRVPEQLIREFLPLKSL